MNTKSVSVKLHLIILVNLYAELNPIPDNPPHKRKFRYTIASNSIETVLNFLSQDGYKC